MSGVVLTGILAATGVGPAAHASQELGHAQRAGAPASAAPWKCWWAPTMDQNWHNDALCSNGVKRVRPHLRPHDTYITRDELMRSARAWARARNNGR